MLQADPSKVSIRAKKRGLPQLGTLGAGNHYAEIQVVEEIFDKHAASKMGIDQLDQVVLMIHCGSRGMGHQVHFTVWINLDLIHYRCTPISSRNNCMIDLAILDSCV